MARKKSRSKKTKQRKSVKSNKKTKKTKSNGLFAKIQKRVRELRKRDSSLTQTEAVAKAWAEYRKE